MFLLLLKGSSGSGKSTIGRELCKYLGWSLIDKDDVLDVFEEHKTCETEVEQLAYAIMFRIAHRQLSQQQSVICDSPLLEEAYYTQALSVAGQTGAFPVVIECTCCDEEILRQRLSCRAQQRTDESQPISSVNTQTIPPSTSYSIVHPSLVIETTQPLDDCVDQVVGWLEQLPVFPIPLC